MQPAAQLYRCCVSGNFGLLLPITLMHRACLLVGKGDALTGSSGRTCKVVSKGNELRALGCSSSRMCKVINMGNELRTLG